MKELIRLMNKQVNVLKTENVESLKDLIFEQVELINDLAERLDLGREKYADLRNAYDALKNEFNRQRRLHDKEKARWESDDKDFITYVNYLETKLTENNIEVEL